MVIPFLVLRHLPYTSSARAPAEFTTLLRAVPRPRAVNISFGPTAQRHSRVRINPIGGAKKKQKKKIRNTKPRGAPRPEICERRRPDVSRKRIAVPGRIISLRPRHHHFFSFFFFFHLPPCSKLV